MGFQPTVLEPGKFIRWLYLLRASCCNMCMALVRDPHEKLANQRMKREGQGAKYFLTVDSEKKKKPHPLLQSQSSPLRMMQIFSKAPTLLDWQPSFNRNFGKKDAEPKSSNCVYVGKRKYDLNRER